MTQALIIYGALALGAAIGFFVAAFFLSTSDMDDDWQSRP